MPVDGFAVGGERPALYFFTLSFAGLVALAGSPEPDPIPNSAVKLPSADGTKS
jgi:hypothetical protein